MQMQNFFEEKITCYNLTEYYRIKLKLDYWRCSDKSEISIDEVPHDYDINKQTTWKDTASWLAQTVKNFVTKSYEYDTMTPVHKTEKQIQNPCGDSTEYDFELHFYPLKCLYYALLFIFTLLLCFLFLRLCKCLFPMHISDTKNKTEKDICGYKYIEDVDKEIDTTELDFGWINKRKADNNHDKNKIDLIFKQNSINNAYFSGLLSPVKIAENRILLYHQMNIQNHNADHLKPQAVPVVTFLSHTTDHLFSIMDKLLLESHQSSRRGSPSRTVSDLGLGSTVVTPRRPLRRSLNTSLSEISEQHDQTSDILEKRAYDELINDVVLKTDVPFSCDVDQNMALNTENKIKKLLQFCLNQGSLKIGQLQVSSLIVNYCLHLISKEILTFESDLHIGKFQLIGSLKKGLKVGAANQFDFQLEFYGRNFFVYEILDQFEIEELIPGKIILLAKSKTDKKMPRCLEKIKIKNETFTCLSPHSVLLVINEIIDKALQNLYTGTKALFDRLPFRIHRSPTNNPILSIDTRNVIGLGLKEISVRILPSICLPVNGWYQSEHVYASCYDFSADGFKSAGFKCPDQSPIENEISNYLWTLQLGNLEELFLNETDKRMEASGIHSCHRTCIRVLKLLFSEMQHKSLLDRGELKSYMIETVIYYLLLESSPEQWTFNLITDRVSDAYLYLKSALESGRLPHFFINNPHLLKKMPFLYCFPFLCHGKQQNLLVDSRMETVDKKLNYIQDRIKNTGLEDCFRDTYSPDTWELEFFVYS